MRRGWCKGKGVVGGGQCGMGAWHEVGGGQCGIWVYGVKWEGTV